MSRPADENEQLPFQGKVIDLIAPLVPPDARERVTRVVKQWNQIIREHIRTETALKLSDGEGRYAIPVRIAEGFPDPLAELIGRHEDPVLWRLIVGQPKLGAAIEGLNYILRAWDAFDRWPMLPVAAKGGKNHLERSADLLAALQRLAIAEQVKEEIRGINEDILGVYYSAQGLKYGIEVYWLPISMVAAMLDVPIEDLSLVVLAHELTHGYTHVGRDIDGTQWNNYSFDRCADEVIEGLAQFYTQVVTEKIAARLPGAKLAFDRLLELQGGPYLAHRDWLPGESHQRGEIVRFAMIAARSLDVVKYEEWTNLLESTRRNLRTRPKTDTGNL